MGMDLRGPDRYFRFGGAAWDAALHGLALSYGWKPAGTEAPDLGPDFEPCKDWGGGYYSNDFQRVTDEDARNLADALERALPDIPNHDAIEMGAALPVLRKVFDLRSAPSAIVLQDLVAPTENPYELFSGRNKAHLQDFIKFCREGGFTIG